MSVHEISIQFILVKLTNLPSIWRWQNRILKERICHTIYCRKCLKLMRNANAYETLKIKNAFIFWNMCVFMNIWACVDVVILNLNPKFQHVGNTNIFYGSNFNFKPFLCWGKFRASPLHKKQPKFQGVDIISRHYDVLILFLSRILC